MKSQFTLGFRTEAGWPNRNLLVLDFVPGLGSISEIRFVKSKIILFFIICSFNSLSSIISVQIIIFHHKKCNGMVEA